MEKLVALAFVFVIVAFVGVYAIAAWKGQGKPKRESAPTERLKAMRESASASADEQRKAKGK
jgi:hypothetical protein